MLVWANICNIRFLCSSLSKLPTMKYFLVFAFLIFSYSFMGQETSETRSYGAVLQQGELLDFGNRSMKFKEVISDSRCPVNVTCIWAGEAKVLVEIFENGRFLEEKILLVNSKNSTLSFITEAVAYSISGIDLMPYPTVQSKNTKPDYSLEMRVSEKL